MSRRVFSIRDPLRQPFKTHKLILLPIDLDIRGFVRFETLYELSGLQDGFCRAASFEAGRKSFCVNELGRTAEDYHLRELERGHRSRGVE